MGVRPPEKACRGSVVSDWKEKGKDWETREKRVAALCCVVRGG